MRHRRDRAPLSAQTALAVILLGTVAIIACIGALSWALLQTTAPAACALVVPALPMRNPLRRWWLRWLMCCNTLRMRETQRQLAQYRRLLADDRLHLDELQRRLAQQQSRQLTLASEP